MHPIDEAIMNGTITRALLEEHVAVPLPPEGRSYWADAARRVMRGHGAERLTYALAANAVRVAYREMGDTLSSLDSINQAL